MKKDKKLIPKGLYCERNGIKCPYWSLREDLAEQENGYCAFLGKTDVERNNEMAKKGIKVTVHNPNGTQKTYIEHDYTQLSMLWDGVKECGVKDSIEDEFRDVA